jgi:sulfate/thiosulfate transport system substrate-binding protein
VAQAYLDYLYSPEGQRIVAHNFYRPTDPSQADPEDLMRFPDVDLVSIDDPLFGGWARRSRRTSPTAASSTRSTSPAMS